MKKLSLIMIILWCFIGLMIVGIIAASIFFRTRFGFSKGGIDNMELLVNQSIPVSEINNVSVNISSDKCYVYESEDENITIKHYGNNIPAEKAATVTNNNGKLSVDTKPRQMKFMIFGWTSSRSTVEIYLPKSYKSKLDVDIKSGTIDFDTPLDLESLDVRISSGVLRAADEIKAKDTSVRVASGTIRFTGGLTGGKYSVKASSGTIDVDGLKGSGDIEVTSGTVRLNGVDIDEKLSVKASSGTINIGIEGDPSLNFTGRKSSGTLRTYFETYTRSSDKNVTAQVGDGPYKDLDVSVTSGTIRITRD